MIQGTSLHHFWEVNPQFIRNKSSIFHKKIHHLSGVNPPFFIGQWGISHCELTIFPPVGFGWVCRQCLAVWRLATEARVLWEDPPLTREKWWICLWQNGDLPLNNGGFASETLWVELKWEIPPNVALVGRIIEVNGGFCSTPCLSSRGCKNPVWSNSSTNVQPKLSESHRISNHYLIFRRSLPQSDAPEWCLLLNKLHELVRYSKQKP